MTKVQIASSGAPKANQGPHSFGGLQHGDIKELLSCQIE